MSEQDERGRVVAIVREWIRTPFIHEGRIKGKCADCTFIAKVYEEAGLMPAVSIPKYSPQAHLNRFAAIYGSLLERYAQREIPEAEAKPGDAVLFLIGRAFSHGGIVIDPGWPRIVHADMGAGFVIEADALSLSEQRRFFTMW